MRFFYPNCEVLRIVDGDTIDVRARWDVGFGVKGEIKLRLRVARIDAPEDESDTKEAGARATAALRAWLPPTEDLEVPSVPVGGEAFPLAVPPPTIVAVETFKTDDFGRYVADIWDDPADMGSDQTINDRLVDAGFAVYKTYGTMIGQPRAESVYHLSQYEQRAIREVHGVDRHDGRRRDSVVRAERIID